MKPPAFKLRPGDMVYIRAPGGVFTDRVITVSSGGVVEFENTKVKFLSTGRPVGESRRSVYRIIEVYKPHTPPVPVDDDWLNRLEVGNNVIIALSNGQKILTTVERITPAGKIKVKHNMELFYKDGTAVHRGRLSAKLEPATPEAKEIIQKHKQRETALKIIKSINFELLEVDKLIKVQKILEGKEL